MQYWLLNVVFLFVTFLGSQAYADETVFASTETIVLLRHGEKPENEIGQINCRGLNRSLQLAQVLLAKFGKPDYLFASNPFDKKSNDVTGVEYLYLRPLMALEPLAIQTGQTINLNFGRTKDDELVKELMRNKYKNSLVFVSWEHKKLENIARDLYTLDKKNGVGAVPKWSKEDFDGLYVLEVKKDKNEKVKEVTFRMDTQNLNDLSDYCP